MQRYEKEEDWFALLGQQESFRLEFKSARIFEKKEKAVLDLSKEISAFANSEGGVILIGMNERKEGKIRVADKIIGLDPDEIAPESLQQILESNLSPLLPGIRVVRVCLSGENSSTDLNILFNISPSVPSIEFESPALANSLTTLVILSSARMLLISE